MGLVLVLILFASCLVQRDCSTARFKLLNHHLYPEVSLESVVADLVDSTDRLAHARTLYIVIAALWGGALAGLIMEIRGTTKDRLIVLLWDRVGELEKRPVQQGAGPNREPTDGSP